MKLMVAGLIAFAALAPQQAEQTGKSAALISSVSTPNSFEALTTIGSVELPQNRSLLLEPGVRTVRNDEEIVLSTHDGAMIEFVGGNKVYRMPSPVTISAKAASWNFIAIEPNEVRSFTARRVPQDDTDSNLKSMQESAKKLKSKTNPNNQQGNNAGKKKSNLRFLFGSSNPMGSSEAFSSTAIQQLTHTSAIGF